MKAGEISPLKAALDYSPDTGELRWRMRFDVQNFSAPERLSAWNTKWAGKPAFSTDTGRGYRQGCFGNSVYLAHRVAWALHYGDWPKGQIDHINGNRSDNRIANLRDVSATENRRNAAKPKNNKSGCVGVSWREQKGKWRASITIGNVSKHLGYFDSMQTAISARQVASENAGFHPNHGRG